MKPLKLSDSCYNVLVLLCVAGTPALAQPELKGTPSELATLLANAPRIVQVTGEAEVKVQADRGIVTVRISSSARELGQALRANQEACAKFVKLLTAQGLAPDQVQASKFSSTEKYGVFSDKVKSHRVNNLLKVTVRNEKEFQVAADASDSLPEAQYLGVEFERSDKEALRAKAIAEACANATQRKQAFEEQLGLKLTVRRFYDPAAGPLPGDVLVSGQSRAMGFSGGLTAGLPSAHQLYSDAVVTHALAQREDDRSGFGELTFRSRVTVEYSVESK
ncbi:MAG TPA: SIMPL domain-containing protein [Verrucomicrobiae bacterium]